MFCVFNGSRELTFHHSMTPLRLLLSLISSIFVSTGSLRLLLQRSRLSQRTDPQGHMANRRHVSLCVLVFLLSVSGRVLGSGHNQIEFRDEKNDISFQNTITFENSTSVTDPPGTLLRLLSNGTAWHYAVPKNTTTILTAFSMVNASGHYFQDVWTWSHVQTPYLNCTTSCSWQIDDRGFSVADLTHGRHAQFVVSWDGPYPTAQ